MTEAIEETLGHVTLFSRLSQRQRARLARFATTRDYPAGATIVRQGDTSMSLYVILAGEVRVDREPEGGGGAVEVERLGPGGAFGEAALVDQAPRLASAVAETDCELQPITRTAFLALVKVSPQFAYSMLASLAERLRFLTARL